MRFYADLHVHSKYSRATSKNADLEHMALWARRKGITVVGTGDFTHPAWFDELRGKLVPAEPGLFRLRPEIEREVAERVPAACQGPVRFLLEVEISTIYKKGDKTRKVHHLIYAATFDAAARLRARLSEIGNLNSDGRPILGLDSRHLLEIALESGCYLIPAHIWTPWFAALGSKSGFDSIEECYGDLSPYIFAVETGLSSDPPMNWRISGLDRFTLVSNSDAHSPPVLGREASVFDTELDYFAIRRALETGEGYGGSVEFFPEEGKYHLDGHRSCGICLEPPETRERGGLCPACGKPLTVGVLHRVEELADRPEGCTREQMSPFRSLVPLPEVLAEIHGVGVQSRAVEESAARLVGKLGPELDILESLPLEDIEAAGGSLLHEALSRLRAGTVRREGGYDGEYGVIRLFEPGEIEARRVVAPLFAPPDNGGSPPAKRPRAKAPEPPSSRPLAEAPLFADIAPAPAPAPPAAAPAVRPPSVLDGLDAEQREAAEIESGPLLIVAGPGTGKTRTLTRRLAHLVLERGVPAEECLAVTFSRRAAAEMAERLAALIPAAAGRIRVETFHSLGLALLREGAAALGIRADSRLAEAGERETIVAERFGVAAAEARGILAAIGRHRRGEVPGEGGTVERAAAYEAALRERGLLDFDDLLLLPLALAERRPEVRELWRRRFRHLSVDEYQDIDRLQYALVRHLVPPTGNLCAIGDPDQSIYGFRGAEVGFFLRFREDYRGAREVRLTRNYRSTSTVVEAASAAIRKESLVPDRQLAAASGEAGERVLVEPAAHERAEAERVASTIEEILGGTSSWSFDSGRVGPARREELSFADVAILYRTEAQAAPLVEALAKAGVPFQKRSHRPLAEQPGVSDLLRALAAAHPGGEAPAEAKSASVESLLDKTTEALATPAAPGARATLRAAAELLRPLATRNGDDLAAFQADAAAGAEIDAWDPRAERVSLLTLHAAKGLEWPVVFLVGCEDGLLPLKWGDAEAGDPAEERRLFFVGLTRSRSRLFLSYARKRGTRGPESEARPSPFLADLPESLVDCRREAAAERPKPVQLRLL